MNTIIQKLICKLENRYPDDNLITCYKDFLKMRDYLSCCQFNPVVFRSLVELTNDLWDTHERINRLSMLSVITQYGKGKVDYKSLDTPTRKSIFELFRNTIEKSQLISENQLEEAQKKCCALLYKLPLTDEEESWFCENINQSNLIYNRILRYPIRSKVISKWVKEHFYADKFHIRRAEAIGWLLDENPDFVIDKQILFDDFEYINKIDTEIINSNEWMEYNNTISSHRYRGYGEHLTFRPYMIVSYQRPSNLDTELQLDFSKLRQFFYENINVIANQTMLWAVAYSHLNVDKKVELLKKYYSDELFVSLLNICRKHNLIEILKWLQTKEINNMKLSKNKLFELAIGNKEKKEKTNNH